MIDASESMRFQHLLKMQRERESAELNRLMGLKHSEKKRTLPFKVPAEDGRLFSNYFSNVIIQKKDERVMMPMRYRIRPQGSKEEIPSKYNVFNARIDALETRQTWLPLFMRQHGIIPFVRFFEWVQGDDQKPKLIAFSPEEREIMWAPCLWDEWISKDGSIQFKSFAIITDGPPPEIERMGHDRCPIFLRQDKIDEWLNPSHSKREDIYDLLTQRENVVYKHQWVS